MFPPHQLPQESAEEIQGEHVTENMAEAAVSEHAGYNRPRVGNDRCPADTEKVNQFRHKESNNKKEEVDGNQPPDDVITVKPVTAAIAH